MTERKDRTLAGYRVVYRPDHFHHSLNTKGYRGYVYEHRYIMECMIGRALDSNEIVHHIDGDKKNNSIDNLKLMTRSEHSKLHSRTEDKFCEKCGIKLHDKRSNLCKSCFSYTRRKVKERPSKDELLKMVEENSYVSVGRMYGVSDNTIRKWIAVG